LFGDGEVHVKINEAAEEMSQFEDDLHPESTGRARLYTKHVYVCVSLI